MSFVALAQRLAFAPERGYNLDVGVLTPAQLSCFVVRPSSGDYARRIFFNIALSALFDPYIVDIFYDMY